MAIEVIWTQEELDPEDKALEEEHDAYIFLAREFLTWLIFHADVHAGKFDGFEIAIGNKVVLRNILGNVTDVTLKGPTMSISPDLRYTIAGGLLGKEIELRLTVGERHFFFSLGAEGLDPKRVRLPAVLDESGDDSVGERMTLLVELDEKVKAAYATFLGLREKLLWKAQVVPEMRTWLEEGTR